jgi:hypothetical protein
MEILKGENPSLSSPPSPPPALLVVAASYAVLVIDPPTHPLIKASDSDHSFQKKES